MVSLPCWQIFDRQSDECRESVLPRAITKRLAIEAAAPFGWHKLRRPRRRHPRYIDRFGVSAPAKDLAPAFGFTAEEVAKRAKALLS